MFKKGFTLIELIFVIIILGILAGSSLPVINQYRDIQEDALKLEMKNKIDDYRNLVIQYYDINNKIPDTIEDLNSMKNINLYDSNKDEFGEDFEILKNVDNSLFNYNGSSIPKYQLAIISKGHNKELDSSINSNSLEIEKFEKGIIIIKDDLRNSKRDRTKIKVDKCNVAYTSYKTTYGSDPLNVFELVGINGLEVKDIYDEWGTILNIDNVNGCYSSGYNMVDDTKLYGDTNLHDDIKKD